MMMSNVLVAPALHGLYNFNHLERRSRRRRDEGGEKEKEERGKLVIGFDFCHCNSGFKLAAYPLYHVPIVALI